MTNALVAHIEAQNAKAQAWMDEADGRIAGMVTTDLDHWAGYGITTVAEYDHYMAATTNFEIYRDINGIKPNWGIYADMTTAEIEADTTMMCGVEDRRRESDAVAAVELAESLGHSVEDLQRWGVV